MYYCYCYRYCDAEVEVHASFCCYNLIVAEFSAESISDDVDVTYLTLSSSLILYCSNIPLTKIKKRILFSSVHHRV